MHTHTLTYTQNSFIMSHIEHDFSHLHVFVHTTISVDVIPYSALLPSLDTIKLYSPFKALSKYSPSLRSLPWFLRPIILCPVCYLPLHCMSTFAYRPPLLIHSSAKSCPCIFFYLILIATLLNKCYHYFYFTDKVTEGRKW